MMEVKVKKLSPLATMPRYAKPGDAAVDLVAISKTVSDKYIEYGTGLAFEIPQGYVGLLFPRSSVSNKDLILSNCVGVIDSGYRGEVTARFKYDSEAQRTYVIGDRVVQMIVMPIPTVSFVESQELSETERGAGGYGSTGN